MVNRGLGCHRLLRSAAIICEHAMRDLRLSGFSDGAITCDRMQLLVNQALTFKLHVCTVVI